MFETIAVLTVFFFLFVIGLTLYFQFQKSGLQKEIKRANQLRALQAAEKTFYLPELDCSFLGIGVTNCYDKLKLEKLAEKLQEQNAKEDYFNTFGFTNITITEVFPNTGSIVRLYERAPSRIADMPLTRSPALLYEPITGRYAFGIVEVVSFAEEI